jgi:hypothetical protein
VAACSPWTYAGITPGAFQSLREYGRRRGFAVPDAPSGSFIIQTAGVKVTFRYDWNKTSGTLRLECTAKPQLVSCSLIKSMANRIVEQCGGKPV